MALPLLIYFELLLSFVITGKLFTASLQSDVATHLLISLYVRLVHNEISLNVSDMCPHGGVFCADEWVEGHLLHRQINIWDDIRTKKRTNCRKVPP